MVRLSQVMGELRIVEDDRVSKLPQRAQALIQSQQNRIREHEEALAVAPAGRRRVARAQLPGRLAARPAARLELRVPQGRGPVMRIKKIGDQWYHLVGHPSGIVAGFRCFGRGSWGLYFYRQDRSMAMGMRPGHELYCVSRADVEARARRCLAAGRIVP